MAAIQDRSEGNERRRDRVAKLDKGPGVFVYDGSAVDHEWTPTPKLIGEGVAKLDGNGLPSIHSGTGSPAMAQNVGARSTNPTGRVTAAGAGVLDGAGRHTSGRRISASTW